MTITSTEVKESDPYRLNNAFNSDLYKQKRYEKQPY